jgi:hypothetical protein
VRRGERFARVYLEHEIVDDVQRIMVVKTEMSPPMHTTRTNAANPYAIWSLDLTDANKFVRYNIGFELTDGRKFSSNDRHRLVDFPLCAT